MQESHPKPPSAAFTPARRRAPPAIPGCPRKERGDFAMVRGTRDRAPAATHATLPPGPPTSLEVACPTKGWVDDAFPARIWLVAPGRPKRRALEHSWVCRETSAELLVAGRPRRVSHTGRVGAPGPFQIRSLLTRLRPHDFLTHMTVPRLSKRLGWGRPAAVAQLALPLIGGARNLHLQKMPCESHGDRGFECQVAQRLESITAKLRAGRAEDAYSCLLDWDSSLRRLKSTRNGPLRARLIDSQPSVFL